MQLATLTPRGIIADQPAEFVPDDSWTGGEGVTFRGGRVNRAGGYTSVYQDSNAYPYAPRNCLYAPHQGTGYWAMMGEAQVFVTDGATHSVVTPAGGLANALGNDWTAAELNGLAVFNNTHNAPFYWDGVPANVCQTLPDWTAGETCAAIRPYKYHLVALSIRGAGGLDDTYLKWSDAAAPGQVPQSWTPGSGSEAGDNVLGDEPGALIDAFPIREDLVIYKQHSCHLMTYVGSGEVMAFRKLFGTVGMLNRNCCVEHRGFHYVLTDGDVVRHNAQDAQSIIDLRNRERLFSLIDADNYTAAFVALNAPAEEICIFVPVLNDTPNTMAIYHINRDEWTFRPVPDISGAGSGVILQGVTPRGVWDDQVGVWDAQVGTWNSPVGTVGAAVDGLLMAAPDDTKTLWLDGSDSADGANVPARLEQLTRDFGAPERVKLTSRIVPHITAPAGTVFTVRVGSQMELGDAIAFTTRTFTVGTDNEITVEVAGKWLSFIFETDSTALWDITRYRVYYTLRGAW